MGKRPFLLFLLLVCVSACTSTVQEKHIFATFGPATPGNPSGVINVFRLNVDAQTAFSNVRYLAGTYDERAVELFLNETKSTPYTVESSGPLKGVPGVFVWTCPDTDDGSPGNQKDPCKERYDDAMKLVPLSQGVPGQAEGRRSFVIILSTNADAISETIGAFATNTQTIQSLNYLLHKETFDHLAQQTAMSPVVAQREAAVLSTLSSLFGNYDEDSSEDLFRELSILQTLAIALEPEKPVSFDTIEEAKAWFATVD